MKIVGNVEDVLNLKSRIKNSLIRMNQAINGLGVECSRLGNQWKDEEYQACSDVVGEIMKSVTRHMEDVEDLLRALDEYVSILEDAGTNSLCENSSELTRCHISEKGAHFFQHTQEVWKKTPDGMVYDSPLGTRKLLELNQGKVRRYKGTCGICSCVNVLRLAGVECTEEELVRFAAKNDLCSHHWFRSSNHNGGTSAEDRKEILWQYGIDTIQVEASVDSIAQAVEEGRGVIASVHAFRLWYDMPSATDFHAVTVTSVKKDFDGNILGFYIADSGKHDRDGQGYYTREVFESALTGRPLNVTTQIIR